jgi:hypothetical protein
MVQALPPNGTTEHRACADKLLAKGEPFDVVIANAGVITPLTQKVISNLNE